WGLVISEGRTRSKQTFSLLDMVPSPFGLLATTGVCGGREVTANLDARARRPAGRAGGGLNRVCARRKTRDDGATNAHGGPVMAELPIISRRRFTSWLGLGAAAAALAPAEAFARSAARPAHGPKAVPAAAPSPPSASGVVRLSSNENPYGPSPAALAALRDASALAWRYPDEHVDALAADLAKAHGVAPEQVLFGAGSTARARRSDLRGDPQGREPARRRDRPRAADLRLPPRSPEDARRPRAPRPDLSLQPEQPDRQPDAEGRGPRLPRPRAGGDRGARRRGLLPLRRERRLRDRDPARRRAPEPDRRPHLLEDPRPRRHASGVRDRPARDDRKARGRPGLGQRQHRGRRSRPGEPRGPRLPRAVEAPPARKSARDLRRLGSRRSSRGPLLDQLLHGGSEARRPAGDRGPEETWRRGRPLLPRAAHPPARHGGDRAADGAVPDGVSGGDGLNGKGLPPRTPCPRRDRP